MTAGFAAAAVLGELTSRFLGDDDEPGDDTNDHRPKAGSRPVR